MEQFPQSLEHRSRKEEFLEHRGGATYERQERLTATSAFAELLETRRELSAAIENQMTDRALVAKWPSRALTLLASLFAPAWRRAARARKPRPRCDHMNMSTCPRLLEAATSQSSERVLDHMPERRRPEAF